jgi:protein TonB
LKRLFLAAVIALALHALLFSVKVEWGKGKAFSPPAPLCLSLTLRNPEIPSSHAPSAVRQPPTPPDPPPPERMEEPKKEQVAQKKEAPAKSRKSPSVPTKKMDHKPERVPVKTEASSSIQESTEQIVPGDDVSHRVPPDPDSTTKSPGGTSASPPPPENPEGDRESTYLREAVPVYRKNPRPEYPSVARRRGYEGMVIMEVFVDREGRVQDLRLYQTSGHEILDRAAMQAVKGWLFEPATRGGNNIEMWVKVPLSFRLK